MSQNDGLNRRAFLQSAGMTALLGAVGAGVPASRAEAASGSMRLDGKYDFDTIYNRVGTDSVKWDQQIRTYGKENIAVGMGIADMDFRCAPSITKALTERLQHENWGYLDKTKYLATVAEDVVAWNRKRYGLDVNPDNVGVTTGVQPGLIAALRAFSPPGSKVLLLTPTYDGFYSDLKETHTIAEESPLKLVNGKYSIDFDDFERRISHETNTFILCNPQNPTGNCWSKDDLMRLGEICLRRRVVVLSDEIHCDFVTRGNKYTPFASLPDKRIVDNSITFKAASKSFGLAAMKCAWFFTDNQDYLARTKAHNRADLTTLGLIASRAAYAGGEDWLNQCVDYIDGTLDYVEKYVAANIPLVKVVKPQGTYLAWLDVSKAMEKIGIKEMTDEANRKKPASEAAITPETMFEKWMVKHAKVQLNAGHTYGFGGQGHMRMNIATSRKLVELALNNMASALNSPQTSML